MEKTREELSLDIMSLRRLLDKSEEDNVSLMNEVLTLLSCHTQPPHDHLDVVIMHHKKLLRELEDKLKETASDIKHDGYEAVKMIYITHAIKDRLKFFTYLKKSIGTENWDLKNDQYGIYDDDFEEEE